jgi:hypothetical protein
MKELAEMLSWVLFVCFILALFFVFSGEPDLWDVWRQRAMQEQKP